MLEMSSAAADVAPRYQLGEDIDFSDRFDCSSFIEDGWSEVGPEGIWTVGSHAELGIVVETPHQKRLKLRALAAPLLSQAHRRISIKVRSASREVENWIFDLDKPGLFTERWLEAELTVARGVVALKISFDIDTPASPLALGLSQDPRLLGIKLRRLQIVEAD